MQLFTINLRLLCLGFQFINFFSLLFDAIILTVAHNEFKELNFETLKKEMSVVYDVKNSLSENQKDKGL